jgi:hypothetical protein
MITARKYSTPELAAAQFSAAIDLYLAGDYVPAIALAGAAEELFGGPVSPKGRNLDSVPTVRSRTSDAEGRAFSILDRVFKTCMLESWEHGAGWDAHPRMTEVGAKHLEVLQRIESAARSPRLPQPSPSARDPQNAGREQN